MAKMGGAWHGAGVSLAYAAVGFSPIVALALAIAAVCSLTLSASVLVGAASVAAVFLWRRFPSSRQAVLEGLCAGLVAVLGYDLARWVTIATGWWGDFIPSIGGWLLGTQQPDVVLGYAYRWLGDGAGMGMAFVVSVRHLAPALRSRAKLALGFGYGVAIWLSLIATLLISPDGQRLLFPLTPVTLVLSLGGHLIYGGVLGGWVIKARVSSLLAYGSRTTSSACWWWRSRASSHRQLVSAIQTGHGRLIFPKDDAAIGPRQPLHQGGSRQGEFAHRLADPSAAAARYSP